MIRRVFFYVIVLSIPAFLALSAWQSSRYGDLERELQKLEKTQETWVENNKRLIAGIALLSSPDRIEHIARDELGLRKKEPEEVLQISIAGAPSSSAFSRAESVRVPVSAANDYTAGAFAANESTTAASAAEASASLVEFIERYGAANE